METHEEGQAREEQAPPEEQTYPATPPADPLPVGTEEATSASERQQAEAAGGDVAPGPVVNEPPAGGDPAATDPEAARERQLDEAQGGDGEADHE